MSVAQALDFDLVARSIEEGRDVGDAHPLDERAVLLVARLDDAGRRIKPQEARRLRMDQSVLERDRDGADGAVAAHGQAAGGLDEQDADVAIGTRRRIEDRARHHVVPAWLEHQAGADPVVFRQEVLAALEHGLALQLRNAAAGHHADRVSAGVTVDAKERVARHDFTRCSETMRSA